MASGLDRLGAKICGYIADQQRRDHADRGDANIYDFYRFGAIVMAINLPIARMKCFGDFPQARLLNWLRWDRDRELIGLTLVAGVNGALEAPMFRRDAGAIEHGTSLVL